MQIITIFICMILVYIAWLKYKDLSNPQILFVGFIGLITFLASLRLYGMIKASSFTYLLIIIGVLMYSVGVFISSNYKFIIKNSKVNNKYSINNKFILIIVSFLLIWTIYRFFTFVLPMIKSGYTFDAIRMVYFGAEIGNFSYNKIDSILEMYLNLPFLYSIIPIIALEISSNKNERELSILTIIIALVWIILSCIISGGRVLIFVLIVELLNAMYINFKKNKNFKKISRKKRKKWYILIIIIALFFALYKLSLARKGEGSYEFMHQTYVYFCGCIPHTSLRLSTIDFKYTYGLTFFSGFLRPIMLIIKYLGNGQFPELYQRTIDIGVYLQSAVQITPGHTYNAFVLPFYYFYYDGNLIGVFIDSLMYGYWCGTNYYQMKKNYSKKIIAKYLLIIIYISTSMVRFNPSLVYFAFAYIYINLCFKKTNDKK